LFWLEAPMRGWIVTLVLALAATSANARGVRVQHALTPELAPVGFLLGRWRSDDGKVADTGQASRGTSAFTVEAGGAALLRRDHTELLDRSGAVAGGLDQVMLVYAEGGRLKADYADGQHVIHYVSATVTPDRSVVFTSAAGGGPTFRLAYELVDPKTLSVAFAMAPPGASEFRPVATGTLKKGRRPRAAKAEAATSR
jgi:hypothetical protein